MNVRVVLAAAAAMAATACGSPPASTPIPSQPGTPAPVTSIIDLSHATAAKPASSDTTVQLSPQLYSDPGNACAGLDNNTDIADAPAACGIPLVDLGIGKVPGAQIITFYEGPKQASVQQGVTAAGGQALANGFEVADAVRQWAIASNALGVLPAIDGVGKNADPIYKALQGKAINVAKLPACVYPTSIRVVSVGSDVQSYIATLGWLNPSATGVVATYDACAGMSLTLTDGSTMSILGHTQKVSILTTGHVNPVLPFGPMFVEDGWAPCGPDALKSVCG